MKWIQKNKKNETHTQKAILKQQRNKQKMFQFWKATSENKNNIAHSQQHLTKSRSYWTNKIYCDREHNQIDADQ